MDEPIKTFDLSPEQQNTTTLIQRLLGSESRARSVAMVHTPGVGWAPDTESHEEQEAHWAAVTEMWERVGGDGEAKKLEKARGAIVDRLLLTKGIRRVDGENARSLAHRLLDDRHVHWNFECLSENRFQFAQLRGRPLGSILEAQKLQPPSGRNQHSDRRCVYPPKRDRVRLPRPSPPGETDARERHCGRTARHRPDGLLQLHDAP
ncbi:MULTISPECIES: hypothetical protein [unclassified Bradyrhizobium]|uniref:hypothetical protein n=1 Tax=unclassified Bradyrhizobium TaxID=2631580 RepID=UPI001FFAA72C|nr:MULTISPECIES: hypothetical protein [unclassified Bradyrhizobium]